jgi:hypothetical protein
MKGTYKTEQKWQSIVAMEIRDIKSVSQVGAACSYQGATSNGLYSGRASPCEQMVMGFAEERHRPMSTLSFTPCGWERVCSPASITGRYQIGLMESQSPQARRGSAIQLPSPLFALLPRNICWLCRTSNRPRRIVCNCIINTTIVRITKCHGRSHPMYLYYCVD